MERELSCVMVWRTRFIISWSRRRRRASSCAAGSAGAVLGVVAGVVSGLGNRGSLEVRWQQVRGADPPPAAKDDKSK
jgi:hypothetical protein